MKKLSILLCLLIMASATFAQMGKRNSAFAALQSGKLTKAKDAIDAAIVHKKTMNDAKTWMYRGQIYIAIHESQSATGIMMDAEALAKAEESLNQAKELDTVKELGEDLEMAFRQLGEKYFNDGAGKYNEKDYTTAALCFEKAESINDSFGIIDTNAIYSGGLAYHFTGEKDKMAVKMERLLEIGYDKANIYLLLAEYKGEKDVDKAIEIVNKGRELYPDNFNMVIAAANIFLSNDRTQEALEALEAAIEMDDTNFTIFHNVGIMYDLIFTNEENTQEIRFNAFDQAVEAYLKAIALNSEYFDSIYNLGAINFNKGVYFLTEADALPLGDKKYDEYKEEANKCFVEALPHLEKATVMQPNDINTLYSLKQIYSRTGDLDKYKVVDEKLKALEQ